MSWCIPYPTNLSVSFNIFDTADAYLEKRQYSLGMWTSLVMPHIVKPRAKEYLIERSVRKIP